MGETFDVAKQMMDHYDTGRLEESLALMSDDIEGADSAGTDSTGHDEARAISEAYLKAFRFKRTIKNYLEVGDTVMLEVELEVHNVGPLTDYMAGPDGKDIPATDVKFTMPAADVLKVKDGKVTYWAEYFDSMAYAEALGIKGYWRPGYVNSRAGI